MFNKTVLVKKKTRSMREEALPIVGFLRIMCYAAAKPNNVPRPPLPTTTNTTHPLTIVGNFFFSLDFKIKNNNHDNQSFFCCLEPSSCSLISFETFSRLKYQITIKSTLEVKEMSDHLFINT